MTSATICKNYRFSWKIIVKLVLFVVCLNWLQELYYLVNFISPQLKGKRGKGNDNIYMTQIKFLSYFEIKLPQRFRTNLFFS